MCDPLIVIYIFLHMQIRCMHLFGKKRGLNLLVHNFQIMIQVILFKILLYLMCASAGLTYRMTSEFHSYVNLEVLYICRKVPTSI